MKIKIALLLLGVSHFAFANEVAKFDSRMAINNSVTTNGYRWIDGKDLPLEGKVYSDTAHYYTRLTDSVTTNVNAGVRNMRVHTTGMQFRFKTSSKKLIFKWVPYSENLAMDHMPSTGVSGIDIYTQNEVGAWQYDSTGRIRNGKSGGTHEITLKPNTPCIVNLPLYNGLKSFSLGIEPDATIEALPPRVSGITKPVIFYGTSITHGGCASRPGLSFVNIIGRDLDVPVVNLGFSGSGHMELEMSEHLAKVDASCYVLDCLWNMSVNDVEKRYEVFIRNLRAKRPNTPIVMAERCDYRNGPKLGHDLFIEKLYAKLIAEGWKNLVYLPKDGMLPLDKEGTVDRVHANDYGMLYLAKAYGKAVCKALNIERVLANEGVPLKSVNATTREEKVEFFAQNVFGKRPVERPDYLVFSEASPDKEMIDGKAIRRQIKITYGGTYGTNSFVVTSFLPKGKKKAPAFLLICNRDPLTKADVTRQIKNEFWPVEEIIARGYAAIMFFNGDVCPDRNTGNTKGVFECFEEVYKEYPAHNRWGTISAWAWGASRIMDWIETEPRIDNTRVAVVGHSRGGKTALWTAVTDLRFAYACVNNSGCSGAKLNHMDLPRSESVEYIIKTFPFWFCMNYMDYANREKEMPFDNHELLSCVAPRLLSVGSAADDFWAGPTGEKKATELARPAWKDPSRVHYHIRPGKHDLTLQDWNEYMDHAAAHGW